MKYIAVITARENDFCNVLRKAGADFKMIHPDCLSDYNLDEFEGFFVLGGTETGPYLFPVDDRIALEEQREKGKKMFVEFCSSIGNTYSALPVRTSHHRLIYCGDMGIRELFPGDLLDDHYNCFSAPHCAKSASVPLLYYQDYVVAHDRIEIGKENIPGAEKWGLWFYDENLMICSFRICDFVKARLAPREKWRAIVKMVCAHVLEEGISVEIDPVISYKTVEKQNSPISIDTCIADGLAWFDNADLLLDNGRSGVLEGFSHHIEPDGSQLRCHGTGETSVRNDCAGEVGGAYLFDYLLKGKEESLKRHHNLASFCFNKMQIKTGLFKGMMRWTTAGWGVCYQDDAARAVLSTLFKFKYIGTKEHLEDVSAALDFLVSTTGTDGLRVPRTDNIKLDKEEMERLRNSESRFYSPHHNGYYHASLLLAYQATEKQEYRDIAMKGLSSIMSVFPETEREHSETEACCRLVFPLACLYETTGDNRHKQWLYSVVERLSAFKHPSGGYCEWDTGYQAKRSRKQNDECSLLANNGDPVADLLYSMNWLPLGFAYAYQVTGDKHFNDLWKGIAAFMAGVQIQSENKEIHGAWTRGLDLDRMECYGIPHDVGWAPCCIQSGWTVGEILMGLQLGKYLNSKKGKIVR